MTMIERVARAVFTAWRIHMDNVADDKTLARTWNDLSDREKTFAFVNAKAAIEAMREFTDEMFDASDSRLVRAELEQNWQNVIDAALKEEA